MPEGDTIHRSARNLDRALAGRVLVRFEAPRLGRLRPFPPGTTVAGVEARGKHCLVHFDDGRTLHTHMRMTGSWHLYRPGERWRRSPGSARVVLEVAGDGESEQGWVAACFAAPVVELVAADQVPTEHLGPDLCLPDPDLAEAARRLLELAEAAPDRTVGEALLDQRVASGVGNVYKSEVCHVLGLDPASPLGAVDADLARRLIEVAHQLLRVNLDTVRRTTTDGGGLAVYGRDGRPCPRCRGTIRFTPAVGSRRSTWWCPSCQPRLPRFREVAQG